MYRLVYVSSATHLFSKEELMGLLNQARLNNERVGITGMLLYKDGDFLQLIEGEEASVRRLYKTIEADPRHRSTIVLSEEPCQERLFTDWSMGFRDLSDPSLKQMPGFNQYMNTPALAESLAHHPSDAIQLLEMFKPAH